MRAIFFKEIASFFHSTLAYIFGVVFILSTAALLWFIPSTSVLAYGYADMGVFFSFTPYALLLLMPALSMRSFSEEYRQGTIELLLTAPITGYKIVLAKYFAMVVLFGCCLLPSLVYYMSLYYLGQPVGNIDGAQVAASYVGLYLLGSSFCAIGLCCSAGCRSQVIAFISTAFVCLVLYVGLGALSALDTPLSSWNSAWASRLSLLVHYQAISQGVIEGKEVLFFIGFSAIFLALAHQLVKHQLVSRG